MPRPITEECSICHVSLVGKPWIDGATRIGPWANMCETCHKIHGYGLGTGRGTKFDKDGNKVPHGQSRG